MIDVKKQARPTIAIVAGLIGLVVLVVLVWATRTFLPLALNGSTGTPPPPSHLTGLAADSSPSSGAALESSIAYAVADVEGNSQKDRDALNGKTVSVSGYLVGDITGGQIIADQPSASASTPRLTVSPSQQGLKIGEKVRFTGLYDSAQNVLKVTGISRSM